jgi:serine/threonine-protein kinase RsbW
MSGYEIRIQKELNSERNAIKMVEPYFFELKDELKIKDELFYNMLIAVTEAVNNAIIHGNQCNPQKIVNIQIEVINRDITVIISDEGSGFDPDKVADPREPENLLKANGRGVFLIKELAENYQFDITQFGTTVKMNFHV